MEMSRKFGKFREVGKLGKSENLGYLESLKTPGKLGNLGNLSSPSFCVERLATKSACTHIREPWINSVDGKFEGKSREKFENQRNVAVPWRVYWSIVPFQWEKAFFFPVHCSFCSLCSSIRLTVVTTVLSRWAMISVSRFSKPPFYPPLRHWCRITPDRLPFDQLAILFLLNVGVSYGNVSILLRVQLFLSHFLRVRR